MANPGKDHWLAVKWLMRYIKGTISYGLLYDNEFTHNSKIVGYVDADYAADRDIRRSLTGFVFTLFGNTISWKSSLQSVVALSTTESEYMAVTEAFKEALWLKELCEELEHKQEN